MINEVNNKKSGEVLLRNFGEWPASSQNLENPNMLKYANLESRTGVIITHVKRFGWLNEVLQVDDILLSVDSQVVGVDGKIEWEEMKGSRIDYRLLISTKLEGDYVELEYLRGKRKLSASVQVGKNANLTPITHSTAFGQYYMFAGLVFIPTSRELLYANWKRLNFTYRILYEMKIPHTVPHQQNVVVSTILPHQINQVNHHANIFYLHNLYI